MEKAIYDISVTRRMSHISQTTVEHVREVDGSNLTESKIEAANSLELQEAPLSKLLSKGSSGGEMVSKEDVLQCLFGQQPKPTSEISQTISAADDRLDQSVVARDIDG